MRKADKAGRWDSDGTEHGDWLCMLATLLLGHRDGANRPKCDIGALRNTPVVVNQASHPQLIDHAVNGTPVVPVVYVLEWFARAATEFAGEDFQLEELNDVQVLKGLVADQFLSGGDLNLVVQAKVTEVSSDRILLSLTLAKANRPRLHYRCSATLRNRSSTFATSTAQLPLGPPKAEWRSNAGAAGRGLVGSAANLAIGIPYGGVLFHGPAFQVIKDVAPAEDGRTLDASIAGVLAQQWLHENWVTDPAALDGLLQLALLWTEQKLGGPSLPTSIATVILKQPPKSGFYQASLRGVSSTANKAICDVILHDDDGNLAAEMLGVETHILATH